MELQLHLARHLHHHDPHHTAVSTSKKLLRNDHIGTRYNALFVTQLLLR
jgi:hypothetical protein